MILLGDINVLKLDYSFVCTILHLENLLNCAFQREELYNLQGIPQYRRFYLVIYLFLSITYISQRIYQFFKLIFYFWLCWVFIATWVFSSCGVQGLLSSCSTWAPHCSGFSCCRIWALGCSGFSSCSAQVQLPCGMWDLPGSGIEPMSPVLAGKFLTTEQPGKVMDRSHSSTTFECTKYH